MTSIIVATYWDLSFKLMLDTSDYAVGAVLGQMGDKILHGIHLLAKL